MRVFKCECVCVCVCANAHKNMHTFEGAVPHQREGSQIERTCCWHSPSFSVYVATALGVVGAIFFTLSDYVQEKTELNDIDTSM